MKKGKQRLSLLLACIICVFALLQSMPTRASVGTVTSSKEIAWGLETGSFTVNGIHAFCCQYVKSRPPVGTAIKEFTPCTDDVMRKILYYGYNGPKNVLGTDAKAHVLTAIALSDAHIGEAATGVKAKYDEFYWDVVNNPSKYPSPPTRFKTYFAITSSGNMQNLVFYEMEKNGYVQVVKASSNTEATEGNSCYSLNGAKYGIYSDASLSKESLVCTLTTNEKGVSETKELPPGTYYAYEIEAPMGYALNTEVVRFQTEADKVTTLNLKDEPQMNPIELLLEKVDAETKANKPQGGASLKGAQFSIRFYGGLWESNIDPATQGVEPTKSWLMETDENGRIYLNSELPLGTVTIQEVKASEGYKMNPTVYIRQITSEGSEKKVNTYQYPTVLEEPIKVEVKKYQKDTNLSIPGTVFELTKPDGSTEEFCTDENGSWSFHGLGFGTYELREKAAAQGYLLNEEVLKFTVDEETKEDISLKMDNEPVPFDLVISKTDQYENMLAEAEFTLYSDEQCQQAIMHGSTDENGSLRLENLQVEMKYYLKETKAPAGYEIDTGVYEIYVESTPIKEEFHVWINGTISDSFGGTKSEPEVYITVYNDVDFVLPQTGTATRLLMTTVGLMLCCISIYQTMKRRKTI